jgi:hypothetical protein
LDRLIERRLRRLIKITRPGWIDGDQLQIGAIKIRKLRFGGSLLGGNLDLDGKGIWHLSSFPDSR